MKKIIYVTPHLSTGGLPQYLLKKIQTFKNDFDIYLVEWDNITGNVLVVQRNRIFDIIPSNKRITLEQNKDNFLDFINQINPDIIHFEEIPEHFIGIDILNKIYIKDRDYFIVVTTHSSLTDPQKIVYTADKYILVSDWSLNKFKNHFKNIPCDIWEYPIEKMYYDKNKAKLKLNFDLNYKHILHVGLFTHGKNQKEIIELSKLCLDKPILFHFVGNQSLNFEDYWKPLMDDLPKNCIWHNEKGNVDDYYMASDLFYFPSLWELNPIVLKEAISYNLPIFIRDLETYDHCYDKISTYISDDQLINKNNIYKKLNLNNNSL